MTDKHFKYTHSGIIKSRYENSTLYPTHRTKLRETKLYWVSHYHLKFHKKTGRGIGNWPVWRLDLNSIKPIVNSNKH
jgi:hypothetical protein